MAMKNGQKLVFTDSPLRTQQNGERVTTSWLGIRIMCHVKCGTDCCFSDL